MDENLEALIRLLTELVSRADQWLSTQSGDRSLSETWIEPAWPVVLGAIVGGLFVAFLTHQVQRALIRYQERIRADELVASPLLEALLAGMPAQPADRTGTAGAAQIRFGSLRASWGQARRLLRHPLCRHLPEPLLHRVDAGVEAENWLQSLWEDGAGSGSPDERAAFVAFVGDSSQRLDAMTDAEVDRATNVAFTAPSDTILASVRTALRGEPTGYERLRHDAEGWHAARRRADELRRAAIVALEEAVGGGRLGDDRRSEATPSHT
jgi:hypothetical protein